MLMVNHHDNGLAPLIHCYWKYRSYIHRNLGDRVKEIWSKNDMVRNLENKQGST
uniref:Uncharacterized protein n=1 Tax=Rhizophora mucronata TaxID=61149 RepID=A0A2P2KWT1_RHIMU